MPETNGNYVSRAELSAHLEPMKADIHEIKETVQYLRSDHDTVQGAAGANRRASDRRLTLYAVGAAIVSAAAWIPDLFKHHP